MRWGFVGTGMIAGWMANVLPTTPAARLTAVASRNINTAQAFASRYGADKAFDSWADMLAWDGIDAVYVATPTSLREEICVAAAKAGLHVLGEKPFASLPSLRRITAACRENGVCFMDATHFVHHPRYAAIREGMAEMIGRPHRLDSSFLVNQTDRHDIRYNPALEPLGAMGDLGWYNMRATLEYLSPDVPLRAVRAQLTRDEETGAVIASEGSLTFDDDSVSNWRCGFVAASVNIQLELSGVGGTIRMDNFVADNEDGSASYSYADSRDPDAAEKAILINSRHSGPALMFGDFAAAVGDAALRGRWMQASERTQALLDAVMDAA